MKKKYLNLFTILLLIFTTGIAQENSSIYATVDSEDAKEIKKEFPNEVEIIATNGNESIEAVYISTNAAQELHHKVVLHGPGYIFRSSKEDAILAINNKVNKKSKIKKTSYTITEDVVVNESLNLVKSSRIEKDILDLVAYGTRFHTKNPATQAVLDQKTKWEEMAKGRSDVSVRIVNHVSTNTI